MLTLAAYNAGPKNVARARVKAMKMGLDPNIWFSNVEAAMAKTAGREPVVYVRNTYKYFIAFSLFSEKRERTAALGKQRMASESSGGDRRVILVALAVLLVSAFFLWRRVS